MENTEPDSKATQPRLVLWVAAVALLVYLVTLNRWLSLGSLFVVAEVNGWNWPPSLSPPVLYLYLLPFKCLPASWVPFALNLASAGLATLVLLVLTRSVALLTSGPTKEYQGRLPSPAGGFAHARTWVPPVFAAVVLGLGLTFWENATVGSGEMVDVLLLACAIWCLLEYRVDPRLSWLYRAALVTGLGVANTWAFIAFLPVLVVATLRLRKLRILRLRNIENRSNLAALAKDLAFFGRLMLWGIAGASIAMVVPIAQSLSPDATIGFWQALLAIPRSCKSNLLLLRGQFWFHPQGPQLLVGLVTTTLLPALLSCIWWPDFADKKLAGLLSLEAIGLYCAHAMLFLTSLIVAFDPPFGPRQAGQTLGLPITMLGLYYLVALSVGYYSDFFLAALPDLDVPGRVIYSAVRWACPKLVVALLLMVAVGLFARNAPLVRALNGPHLARFARSMVDSLPPEGAIVFSGDAPRLVLLRAALENDGNSARFPLVNSSAFGLAPYRAWLQRHQPVPWLTALPQTSGTLPASGAPASSSLTSVVDQTRFIAGLTASNRVSYLEWAVGPLLELVYLEPRGLVYELRPNSTNRFSAPPLTPEQMAANEALWKHIIETEAKPIILLLKQAADTESGGKERLRQWSRFRMPPPPLIVALAKSYACALNSWGVVLQKQKKLGAAAQCFSLASELNPDNHLARVNLQCNQDLQAGHPVEIAPGTPVEEGLRTYRDWYSVLADNGPCDEPGYLYRLAVFYQKESLWRQTGQQLERALELAPSAADARLVLASVYLHCQLLDSALRTVQEIQAKPEWQPRIKHPELILGMLQAQILYAMANPSRADQVLRSLLETHPDDPDLVDLARSIFMAQRSYANAAWAADLRLQLTPDYIPALVDKGRSQVRSGAFSNAIPVLTQVLSLTNRFDARFLRAEAYANLGKLDAATDDYRQLLQEDPHSPEAYSGLAELARARGDTNEAIRCYQLCLTNLIPTSEAAKHATLRLRELIPK